MEKTDVKYCDDDEPGHVDSISMEKKFIRKYKLLPHLWNPNHPDYNNRIKRNAGYDALLPIFRQYMPKATRFHIRQKINILRSCYRKERKKYLASSTIDHDGNVVYSYIPRLWKYHAMRFLDEDVEHDVDVSEIENGADYEDDHYTEYLDTREDESGNDEPDTSKIDITPLYLEEEHLDNDQEDVKPFKRKRSRTQMNHSYIMQGYSEDELLKKEFNAIGANVACKLQRMTVQQRYHAELLINKVLINGLKESLTDATDLTNTWTHQLEESLNYNQINTSSKEETNNSTADQSYEIDIGESQ